MYFRCPLPRLSRRPLSWVAGILVLATLAAPPAHAGTGSAPRAVRRVSTIAPQAAPPPVLTRQPYLCVIGPTAIRMELPPGPRLRRPPSLPSLRRELRDATVPGSVGQLPRKQEPSVLSPDAPVNLLPVPTATPPPPPAAKSKPPEDTLSITPESEPELTDAVIYFDGPRRRGGAVVAPVPFTSPAGRPQPESRATYKQE